MKVFLTDGSGSFDTETATSWEEDSWWDGSNPVSIATGSQWDHERLYYTASGNWVLNWWSQYEHKQEAWTQITQERAIGWLVAQENFDVGLPVVVREAVESALEAADNHVKLGSNRQVND